MQFIYIKIKYFSKNSLEYFSETLKLNQNEYRELKSSPGLEIVNDKDTFSVKYKIIDEIDYIEEKKLYFDLRKRKLYFTKYFSYFSDKNEIQDNKSYYEYLIEKYLNISIPEDFQTENIIKFVNENRIQDQETMMILFTNIIFSNFTLTEDNLKYAIENECFESLALFSCLNSYRNLLFSLRGKNIDLSGYKNNKHRNDFPFSRILFYLSESSEERRRQMLNMLDQKNKFDKETIFTRSSMITEEEYKMLDKSDWNYIISCSQGRFQNFNF